MRHPAATGWRNFFYSVISPIEHLGGEARVEDCVPARGKKISRHQLDLPCNLFADRFLPGYHLFFLPFDGLSSRHHDCVLNIGRPLADTS